MASQDLENAPKGKQVTSKDQAREIHQFYGVSPHWEEGETMKYREGMESEEQGMETEEVMEMQKQDEGKKKTINLDGSGPAPSSLSWEKST